MSQQQSAPARPWAQLPPAGPAWAGSLMGVSIAATLSHVHGANWLSWCFLALATAIFLVLIGGFLRRRNPRFEQPFMAPWGMAVMGTLALGSAWTAATGSVWPQAVSWFVATPAAFVVGAWQLRRFIGEPQFLWGLALVTPMVSATSGAQLAHSAQPPQWLHMPLLAVAAACFAFSFITAVPLFAYLYLQLRRGRMHIPPQLAGTNWIPLGVVGQSTAAAIILTSNSKFAGAGIVYGVVMFAAGIAPAIYAAYKYWGATVTWPAYTPGWWGATFPVGTLCLGTHTLATATGTQWLDAVSVAFLVVLIAHIAIAVAAALATATGVSGAPGENRTPTS